MFFWLRHTPPQCSAFTASERQTFLTQDESRALHPAPAASDQPPELLWGTSEDQQYRPCWSTYSHLCVFVCFFSHRSTRRRKRMYVLYFSVPIFLQQIGPLWFLQFLLDAFYEERYFYFAQLFWAESGHCVLPCLTLSNLQRFADALFSWPQWFSVSFLSSMSLNELASFNTPAMRHEFEMERCRVLSCWTTCLYWQHCDASPSQIEACGHSAHAGVQWKLAGVKIQRCDL